VRSGILPLGSVFTNGGSDAMSTVDLDVETLWDYNQMGHELRSTPDSPAACSPAHPPAG